VQPPSVLIAANPYESELVRRALVETGLHVVLAEGGEGTLPLLEAERPLVLVVALGLFDVDACELVRAARAADPQLTILLIADRDGEIADEAAAERLGATRLFWRPVDGEVLADAIEKRAVEAEQVSEFAAAAAAPPASDDDEGEPIGVEQLVELQMEAEPESASEQELLERVGVHRIPRAPTERIAPPPLPRALDPAMAPPASVAELAPVAPAHAEVAASSGLIAPLPTTVEIVSMPVLLRADDTLAEAAGLGLASLIVAPEVVVTAPEAFPRQGTAPDPLAEELLAHAPTGQARASYLPEGKTSRSAAPIFADHSTVAQRLEKELSAAEQRLFPDSPSRVPTRDDLYDDALADIDLDALGIDTLPTIATDELDLHPVNGTSAASEPAAVAAPLVYEQAAAPPFPEESGELRSTDILSVLAGLHAAGWSGRLTLSRGDGERSLYFDDGLPVAATSSFTHDRLGELMHREGVLSREQYQRAREVHGGGRRAAQQLVDLGLLKPSELFAMLRRQVEEILFACFAWESGHYRLGPELVGADDRVRLSAHPWALFLEGVRRKYSLERLVERVGPADTVLAPTRTLERALAECALTPQERARAELIDGERSLLELERATPDAMSEVALYAQAWTLIALGAVRISDESTEELAQGPAQGQGDLRPAPTLIDHSLATPTDVPSPPVERRAGLRDSARGDRAADRTIDRERVQAKRSQALEGDYFAVLGLEREASEYEVGRAFARLSGEFAPQRFAEPLRSELAEALSDIQEVLAEAHRVLSDATMRARYRSNLPPP
jgi:DNA-binding response OmpR family regulator